MQSKLTILIVAIISGIVVAGCDDARKVILNQMNKKTIQRNLMVEQALRNALLTSTNAETEAWRDFLSKWPSARRGEGYVWDEASNIVRGDASATTVIEGRYIFKAILNFEMNPNFEAVTFPKLRFEFSELKRITVPPEGAAAGGVSISFQPDTKWLGLKEWRHLVDSNWNFSSLGIEIVSNAPVQNIEAAIPRL